MTDRTLTIALALFALVLVATDVSAEIQPNTWLFRDGRFYANVNDNILRNGSLEDPFADSWYSGTLGWNRNLSADFSNRAMGAHGERYHFRPWILPVLSTPLFFALGLFGLLVFNGLLYGLLAAGAYRFVRAYTEPLPAAVVAVAMVLASGFRHHVYNYSVDLLLVTAFVCALAGLIEKKGWAAGALVAAAVMIKPTVLLYAPALAVVLWERRDGKTLKEAIFGGSIMLGLYGVANWIMFGRPWWTGYTRVVTVENGEIALHSDTNAFATPLSEGAWDLFAGPDGVVWWHGLFVLVLPGLVVALRRFPRSALAVTLTAAASFALFSKFLWHHDRFLFPTIALLSVPLALGMKSLGDGLRGALSGVAPLRPAATLVFVAAFVVAITSALTGGPLSARQPDEGAIQGAIALGEGAFDLHEATSDVAVRTGREGSTVSIGADLSWRPRASPLALLPYAPLARAFGVHGVLVASSLVMAAAIAALAWLLRRRLPTPLAAAVALGALLVGPTRDAAIGRPIETLAALLLVAALARAVHASPASAPERTPRGRSDGDSYRGAPLATAPPSPPAVAPSTGPFVLCGVLAAASGVVLEQPLLGVVGTLGVALLGRFTSREAFVAALGAGLAVTGLGALVAWIVWGHPLASAESFVAVDDAGGVVQLGHPGVADALALLLEGPSRSRAIVPLLLLLPFATLAIVFGPARDRRLGVAMAVLTCALAIPGALMRHDAITPLAVLVLVAAAGIVAHAVAVGIARTVAGAGARRPTLVLVLGALGLCLAVGLARRAEARHERFWIGTPSSVRAATVHLGEAPCDFLAWENMAWECAMLDGGAMGRVGLALPDRPRVAGRPVHMLLVPTGLRRADPRVVRWEHVASGPRLHLVVGAPDGEFTSPARVTVRVDGTELGTFDVERGEDGLRDHVFDTPDLPPEVALEIELVAVRRGQQAAIVVAGGFVP